MKIFPAIDLKDNKCVRLTMGEDGTSFVFNPNPIEQAKYFEDQGCARLHLIDLDSAFGSLGITPEPEKEDVAVNTASALDTLGKNNEVSQNVDDSEINQAVPLNNHEEQTLPKVNCSYCDQHLTLDDKWIECPDCGIYSLSTCKEGKDTCARCGSKN